MLEIAPPGEVGPARVNLIIFAASERWMSGLSHTPGKRAYGETPIKRTTAESPLYLRAIETDSQPIIARLPRVRQPDIQ